MFLKINSACKDIGRSMRPRVLLSRSGLTLVELLVVISILVVVAALLVPRMRIINKDRNLRESARVVASLFASASQRAVNEGIAGIEIQRNPNIVDAQGVNYAGTVLYVMRRVPAYTGDDLNAQATVVNANTVTIPLPWEQADLAIIQANDTISFNFSSVRYRINAVAVMGTALQLTLDMAAPMPPLPQVGGGGGLPFVVHRLPRRLESSRTELPEGYIIDLRLSGEIYDPAAGVLPTPRPVFYEVSLQSVGFLFDQRGGVDRFYMDAVTSTEASRNQYLLIREYETDEPTLEQALDNPANLWVTVGRQTGAANVADMQTIGPPAGRDLRQMLEAARTIATLNESTNQ